MALIDARGIPADQTSVDRLAEDSLDYRLLDVDDDERVRAFQRALARGFLGADPTAETRAEGLPTVRSRRNIGVYEHGAAAGDLPVATIDSWVTPLTLPGGEIGMWAISGVTVSGTHRRRGIARALLEGELRAAAAAGVSLAGLTASEATIYGRYGFGSAIPVARFTVDTRRAGWAGPAPRGRIEYVEREQLAADLGEVHDRARSARSGQVPGWAARWVGIGGLAANDTERERVRGVCYRDEDGVLRGVMAYAVSEKGESFRFALHVRLLVGETAEATAALWRFALQHDLVDEVTADLRPLDDPLPWLVADQRGVTQVVHDHGWLRILDVPRTLSARRYGAPLDTVLRVDDPLGFAAGTWRLRVDGTGAALVDVASDAEPDLALDVSALSSLYAGGVRASALHAAGRIVAAPTAVEALERAFAVYPAASLDIWY
ncbi:GNAT family N-acetyltransferase [Microbacterium sp. p3-SID336]|uniref:GNAT family N-acetyltransferase n=1 Tax=Microbacterium sp. p3-SID336 TaxID=2916212 RepID=UPI0021A680F4|nr:GNAT family N-acetyltransferase [Microbacterium sp. p3-SID336]MCT1480046.1 GNAT family N-acetyltransferase [Microbacterium sp. p3-SID336]